MKSIGYYNGQISELNEMVVPILDRGYYFGDGIYDATYSQNYQIMFLQEHINRFYDSANALEINIPIEKGEMKTLLVNLINLMDSADNFVYFQATRSTAVREHVYLEKSKANISIMIRPKQMIDVNSDLTAILVEDNRHLLCNIKTLNLLPNVLACNKAYREDAYEAIFHRNGRVTECSHSNIHIIKNEKIYTAPLDNLILPGVTRQKLLQIARLLGYEVIEKPFMIEDLYNADEIFITAAGTLCNSITKINGHSVGGKNKHMMTIIKDKMLELVKKDLM